MKNDLEPAKKVLRDFIHETEKVTKTAHALFRELADCIEQGLDPTIDEVQSVIQRHHALAPASAPTLPGPWST